MADNNPVLICLLESVTVFPNKCLPNPCVIPV
jgi:hypothetical protein